MLRLFFERLQSWKSSWFKRLWLGPPLMSRALILAALVLALMAVFANVKVRHDQGKIWRASPEITKIAGAMSFSTVDAPYYLGHAAAAENGLSPDEFERKRSYPNIEILYQQSTEETPLVKRPLLSTLISLISPSASPGSLLSAGHTILLVSAGLTALMIMLAFGATGYWLEGAAAAIGGGLSSAYLIRSSYGRIDTDQLNLGLMYLMFGLVMLSARSKTAVNSVIWAVAAGFTAQIFMAWYGKSLLILMALAAYAWLLIVLKKNKKIAALCLLLFYALAPISPPNPFESDYVQDDIEGFGFLFPNTLTTITETARISLSDIFVSACGSLEMGLVCVLGLGLWTIRHPVNALAYGPLAAFALLNFVVGNRAVFYSAPILWFGAAFLVTSATRFVVQAIQSTPNNKVVKSCVTQTATVTGALLAMIIAWVNSPTDYLPHPSFPKPVLQGLIKLEGIATSERSVVASWWDYGYASLFLNNLPTLHDGGTQIGPNTHFVASALLKSDQKETVGILQFLARAGNTHIGSHNSSASLNTAFNTPASGPIPDIYLVLTSQMAGWIGSISKLGNWNIETGKPLIPQNNNGKAYVDYIALSCNYRGFPSKFTCGSTNFDFDSGLMNDAPNIIGWTHAREGFAEDVRRYSEEGIFGVQTLQTNKRLLSQLMHRQLYDSSFNKLFHLGLIETSDITLVYDDYPHIRIYRIAGTNW